MTVDEIGAFARRLVGQNSTSYTDAEVLIDLNLAYGLRILDILRLQVDRNASQTEVTHELTSATGLSVGTAGYNGEYPFPTDLLRPIRFEISYDGTNYYRAEVYDLMDTPSSEFVQADLNATYTQSQPVVRFDRGSYFVRPIPTTTVSAGIHIWYEKRQTAFTGTSDTPDIEANYHQLLAFDIAEYFGIMFPEKVGQEQMNRIRAKRNEIEASFKEFYKNQFLKNLVMRPAVENFGTGPTGRLSFKR